MLHYCVGFEFFPEQPSPLHFLPDGLPVVFALTFNFYLYHIFQKAQGGPPKNQTKKCAKT
jgi:hypothetical protein